MLGVNLEEERKWVHPVKTRQRQHINVAALYYINNKKL